MSIEAKISEHSSDPLSFIKGFEFSDVLNNRILRYLSENMIEIEDSQYVPIKKIIRLFTSGTDAAEDKKKIWRLNYRIRNWTDRYEGKIFLKETEKGKKKYLTNYEDAAELLKMMVLSLGEPEFFENISNIAATFMDPAERLRRIKLRYDTVEDMVNNSSEYFLPEDKEENLNRYLNTESVSNDGSENVIILHKILRLFYDPLYTGNSHTVISSYIKDKLKKANPGTTKITMDDMVKIVPFNKKNLPI